MAIYRSVNAVADLVVPKNEEGLRW